MPLHVVAHTHWDREWYHGAARFQTRLSRLVGNVLGLLERRTEWSSFLLDGQAITLEDHLAMHPEDGWRLAKLLGEGRIECGPWYVLPDELLVSAEALVRNLLMGSDVVRRFGGAPLPVGYSPDAFGHSGILPLLLRGFGIDTAVAWRGFGGERGQERDLYRWRAADGSEVLLIHLAAPGYEYGANLPVDPAAAAERWRQLAALLGPRAATPHWLVLCGADHHEPSADLPEAVTALRKASGAEVTMSTLEHYAAAVRAAAPEDLPVVSGELRDGRRHAWALQGTHSARLYLKRWNAHCQRLLERVTEPLAALATARRAGDLVAEVRVAWHELLANHPHDSICGTSADAVHREMLTRFARCRERALETAARALDVATKRDADAARSAGRARWKPTLCVFNPASRATRAVVIADVALFLGDVAVGQGSRAEAAAPGGRSFRLADPHGRPLAYQELGRRRGFDLTESPRHYPDCDAVEWVSIAVEMAELPPLGVTTVAVLENEPADEVPASAAARAAASTLENEQLLVRVDDAGALEIVDRATGEHYAGVGTLEHAADLGDSYTSSRRGRPQALVPDAVAVDLVHAGPLRAELVVRRRYDASGLDTEMRVTLDAGARLVQVAVGGTNALPDRRIRFAAPLGTAAARETADMQFGPVDRTGTRRVGMRDGDLEAAPGTAPMQRYVAVAGEGGRGLVVMADGLPEYEVDERGTVFVTLLRGFGELSKPDLPERPGHAGWPTATPDAQCLGPFAARLAVMPFGGGDDVTAIEPEVDAFLAPPFTRMIRATLERPADIPGPTLTGEGLVYTAMKPAEDGRGIILRCYNGSRFAEETRRGAWEIPWKVKAAALCRLDETDLSLAKVKEGRIEFDAPPRAVVTLRIR